jgi:MFS family permease
MRHEHRRARKAMHRITKQWPIRRMAWLVWGISALFCLFQFAIQLSSASMLHGFMHSFALTAFGASVLASSYYYVYVALQLPAGILIDRFGPRRLLSIGALVCALSSSIMAVAPDFYFALFARIGLGAGSAFAFVGSLSLIARWFPLRRFALMVSIAETAGMVGACFGSAMVASLVAHAGWRAGFHAFTIIALLLCIALWAVVRDHPVRLLHRRTEAAPPTGTKLLSNLLLIVRHPVAWVNACYSGLMYSVITVFVALWGVSYFQLADHFSLVQASWTAGLAFLGVAAGSPVVGWLDAHFYCRRYLVRGGPIGCFLIFSTVLWLPSVSSFWLGCLMFFLGVFVSPYILSFAVASDRAPYGARSAALGFVNTLAVGSAPLFQPLVGWVIFRITRGHHTHSVHALMAYREALIIIEVCLFLACILAWFLPEKRALDEQV